MKKEEIPMFRSILSLIAGASLHMAAFSANSICPIFLYELDMPERLRSWKNKTNGEISDKFIYF